MRVHNIGNYKRLPSSGFLKMLVSTLPVQLFLPKYLLGHPVKKGGKERILHSHIINPFSLSLLRLSIYFLMFYHSNSLIPISLIIAHGHVQASKNHTSRVLGHVARILAMILNTEFLI